MKSLKFVLCVCLCDLLLCPTLFSSFSFTSASNNQTWVTSGNQWSQVNANSPWIPIMKRNDEDDRKVSISSNPSENQRERISVSPKWYQSQSKVNPVGESLDVIQRRISQRIFRGNLQRPDFGSEPQESVVNENTRTLIPINVQQFGSSSATSVGQIVQSGGIDKGVPILVYLPDPPPKSGGDGGGGGNENDNNDDDKGWSDDESKDEREEDTVDNGVEPLDPPQLPLDPIDEKPEQKRTKVSTRGSSKRGFVSKERPVVASTSKKSDSDGPRRFFIPRLAAIFGKRISSKSSGTQTITRRGYYEQPASYVELGPQPAYVTSGQIQPQPAYVTSGQIQPQPTYVTSGQIQPQRVALVSALPATTVQAYPQSTALTLPVQQVAIATATAAAAPAPQPVTYIQAAAPQVYASAIAPASVATHGTLGPSLAHVSPLVTFGSFGSYGSHKGGSKIRSVSSFKSFGADTRAKTYSKSATVDLSSQTQQTILYYPSVPKKTRTVYTQMQYLPTHTTVYSTTQFTPSTKLTVYETDHSAKVSPAKITSGPVVVSRTFKPASVVPLDDIGSGGSSGGSFDHWSGK